LIAVIVDLVVSREAGTRGKKRLDRRMRKILAEVRNRFGSQCGATPSLTQGDSIELLVTGPIPVMYLFHRLMVEGMRFRVGLGTGRITVYNEYADECDGPAFWNAREALEEIRRSKHMKRRAAFRVSEKGKRGEEESVLYCVLFLAALQGMTATQLRLCFRHLWHGEGVTQIAKAVKTSLANVSKALGKTPCYLLADILSWLGRTA